MISGIIILTDGTAQLLGDVDIDKLLGVVKELTPQLEEQAQVQAQDKLDKFLSSVDPAVLEKKLKERNK